MPIMNQYDTFRNGSLFAGHFNAGTGSVYSTNLVHDLLWLWELGTGISIHYMDFLVAVFNETCTRPKESSWQIYG